MTGIINGRIPNKPMRIALLSHALRGGGSISVGQNLIAALGRIAPDEKYLVSVPGERGYETICRGLPDREIVPLEDHSWMGRWLFERRTLPARLERFRPKVIAGLGGVAYQGKTSAPQAILVHWPHLVYPRRHFGRSISFKAFLRIYLKRRLFVRDLGRVRMLFAPTRVMEDRIRRIYGYPGPATVLPNAVSRFIRKLDGPAPVPEPLRTYGDRFKLFCLARYYPHKNIEVLVDLFDRYRRELRGTVLFLTVSGKDHPAVRGLLRRIREKGLEGTIVNIGSRWLQPELENYFRNVNALLLPSLMEVFSGSYLEAMNYGVPILTSDLDFAQEVCGKAALYFDPWAPASVLEAIMRLRNSPGTAEALIRAGRERAEGYFIDWDRVAEIFLAALRSMTGEDGLETDPRGDSARDGRLDRIS